MTVHDICDAIPSAGSECPNKKICKFHISYVAYKAMDIPKSATFISAFYCSSRDWHKFEMHEPFDKDPFLVLSNDMIIRHNGKNPKSEMEIYKVVIPSDYKTPLLFDGNSFFTTEDIITLEPHSKLTGVYIKNKGEQ